MNKILAFILITFVLALSYTALVSAYTSYNYRPGRAWYYGSEYPVYNTFPATFGYYGGVGYGGYGGYGGSPAYYNNFFPGYSYGPSYLFRGVYWDYPTSYGGMPGYFGGYGGYGWGGGYGVMTPWPNSWRVYDHYRW